MQSLPASTRIQARISRRTQYAARLRLQVYMSTTRTPLCCACVGLKSAQMKQVRSVYKERWVSDESVHGPGGGGTSGRISDGKYCAVCSTSGLSYRILTPYSLSQNIRSRRTADGYLLIFRMLSVYNNLRHTTEQ